MPLRPATPHSLKSLSLRCHRESDAVQPHVLDQQAPALSKRLLLPLACLLLALLVVSPGCGGSDEKQAADQGEKKYQPGEEKADSGVSKSASQSKPAPDDQGPGGSSNTASTGTNASSLNGQPNGNSTTTNPLASSNSNGGGSTLPDQIGANAPSSGGTPVKPPTLSSDKLDQASFKIPANAGPNEIVAFLQRMNELVSQTRSAEDEKKIQHARIEAADLLFTPDADESTRMTAIRVKASALQRLFVLGEAGARDKLIEYCTVLTRDTSRAVAALGELYQLGLIAQDYFSESGGSSYEQMRDKFASVVQEYNDQFDVYMMVQDMINTLYQIGDHQEQSEDLLKLATDAFIRSPNPQLAQAGKQMADQLKLVQLNYDQLRVAVFEKQENADRDLVETTRRLLNEPQVSAFVYREGVATARLLEMTQNYTEARQVYTLLEAAASQHVDENLARIGTLAAQNAFKRLDLLGKPLEVTGKTFNDEPFDWESFRAGNYVLIIFWATNWQESLRHFPDYQQISQLYKDQPIKLLGINVDSYPDQAELMLKQVNINFLNLKSADDNQVGPQSPMAQKCGADSAPYTILVDPNGEVIAIHLYHDELFEVLKQKLGGE